MVSFVEKALNRLKREEKGLTPVGEMQQGGSHDDAAPVDGSPVNSLAAAGLAGGPLRRGKVVTLDRDRLREAGFLAPEKYQRRMGDEYRRIKRPLIANAFGIGVPRVADGNLVLISSAVSGEGKTHTCLNLALSIAMERDNRVLLVDGDVPKPHISRLFGIAEERGLLDALADHQLGLEQLIIATDIPHLSVLPAGHWNDHATELLASERMRKLCQELAQRYPDRIVLFDSPPLLAATEAQAIGAVAGQVVLVIAENITPRDDVKHALSLVDEHKPVNAILNKSRRGAVGGYYTGGYGYGYGYGAQADGGTSGDAAR